MVYHGNTLLNDLESLPCKKKDFIPYFLYVGGRSSYKNFKFLLKAFSIISQKYRVNLICTGSNFTSYERKLLAEYNINDWVKASIIRNDEELCLLYKNAISIVYPSLYEGFGMPILEAFACHCPVLLSNTSCFPEIAQDAGLYFSPYELESLVHSMELILLDDLLRNSLINKGLDREKEFSWNKTANQTLEVYKSVL